MALKAINDQLGSLHVEWVGTFDDLCTEESGVASDVRARFWEQQGDADADEDDEQEVDEDADEEDRGEGDDKPIPAALRDQFAEFVAEIDGRE